MGVDKTLYLTPYFYGQVQYKLSKKPVLLCPDKHTARIFDHFRFCPMCGKPLLIKETGDHKPVQLVSDIAEEISQRLFVANIAQPMFKSPLDGELKLDWVSNGTDTLLSNQVHCWQPNLDYMKHTIFPWHPEISLSLDAGMVGVPFELSLDQLNQEEAIEAFIDEFSHAIEMLGGIYYQQSNISVLKREGYLRFGILRGAL